MSITHKDHFVNIARRRAAEANQSALQSKRSGKEGHFVLEHINGYHSELGSAPLSKFTGGYFADQFENLANYRAHYEGTGPEIWEQTEGRLDAFVAAAGTGGTLAGVSRFLKVRIYFVLVCHFKSRTQHMF